MTAERERSPGELSLIGRVSKVCAELPETLGEVDGFGHTAFRVAGKPFVLIGAGRGKGSLSIKADPATQAHLVAAGPYIRTPGLGHHGWVTLWGDASFDWDEVTELIRDAWLRTAPKRLSREIQG